VGGAVAGGSEASVDRSDEVEVVDGVQEDGSILRTELTDAERRRLFEAQVLPLADRLYGAAMRYTRDPVDAQDLLQEAMVKAFRSFHQYQQGTNLKAWLYRVLHTTYLSMYRKQQRRPQENLTDDWGDHTLFDAVVDSGSVEEDVLASFTDQAVKDALADLPEQFRMAVYLADIEGFAYKEIAEIMDTPVGTVMSRIHRGRKGLQQALTQYARQRGILGEDA
jgi:RNA polymerase sigma-70 factor (ECF subfamily)